LNVDNLTSEGSRISPLEHLGISCHSFTYPFHLFNIIFVHYTGLCTKSVVNAYTLTLSQHQLKRLPSPLTSAVKTHPTCMRDVSLYVVLVWVRHLGWLLRNVPPSTITSFNYSTERFGAVLRRAICALCPRSRQGISAIPM